MLRRLLLTATTALALGTSGCLGGTEPKAPTPTDPASITYAPSLGVDLNAMTKTPTGLYYQDVTVGTGATAVSGSNVTVEYTAFFPSGTKLDASADHGGPFGFQLGRGQVIAGWDQGIAGMRVGGVRKLVVPPLLGYGLYNYNGVPGNSVLVFDVRLVSAS